MADMDELMFNGTERETIFRSPEINYNIEKFATMYPDLIRDMRKEWIKIIQNVQGAVIWPRWLEWFPFGFDLAYGMVREVEEWRECIRKSRGEELFQRMKQSDPWEWIEAARPKGKYLLVFVSLE